MFKFISQGIEISYKTVGNPINPPILLIHGFGSNYINNWIEPGWDKYLVNAGYFVVMIDNRGHGRSKKLYKPSDYDIHKMANDAYNLMVYLNLNKYDVMGYSMGARISAFLAMQNPTIVKKVILGGLGYNIIDGIPEIDQIIAGLLANNLSDINNKLGRMFRIFANQTNSDLEALAACMQASKRVMLKKEIQSIKQLVLVVIGTIDEIAGDAQKLIDILLNGYYLEIPKRNHMFTIGDKIYKNGVIKFLS